ncbi:MAG TPA: bifunctional 4-hydroxy-2-oxoglutarate aldolase/2-dehydro-3-deoxy-phosphogluconate aldolase [Herpetosiphonaceae bacterium]|nr:bifunctional 4-hydroxy-2-oxoglutarate aldolase/2-dehydro-3-deoxy-phosphogluconate aldolase [Herpetosiphonaceae bacterium]
MTQILDSLLATRIIAVVRLERYDQAVPVAEALLQGGISAIEFTLTGSGALEAVAKVRAALGTAAQIGVGTVLAPDAAEAAISAGAEFVVTPAVRPAVIATCRAHGVPILSGALTPTEVLAAHEAGADAIKIFPARAVGPQYLRDLLAPLPGLLLVPTGGIDAGNARAYLDAGAVAVGIGGSLVSAQAVTRQDWSQITSTARACVEAIQ